MKNQKRIISLLLSFIMVISIFNVALVNVSAGETDTTFSGATIDEAYPYFEYEVLETGTAAITGYNGTGGDITIPSTLGGYAVTSIGSFAFERCSSLTSVIIPDSVMSIDSCAFFGCINLISVTIGESVTSIGGRAFEECNNLANVNIPNSVQSIGLCAFYGNKLTSITIPDSVLSIDNFAFGYYGKDYYNKIKGYTIYGYSNSVAETYATNNGFTFISIGNSSHNNDSKYSYVILDDETAAITDYNGTGGDITIPSSLGGYTVTTIGNAAFQYHRSLTSVIIPDTVTTIESDAFDCCDKMTSVTIGNSVETIGEDAFYGCSSLRSVNIKDIGAWCSIDFNNRSSNPLDYNKNLYLNGELVTDLSISDSVTSISSYAFFSCASLTSVSIGDSVESIGSCAFRYCNSLTSVSIGGSVKTIREDAFESCSNLMSISIGDSVETIGSFAFHDCSKQLSVTVPVSVTSIGYKAFGYYGLEFYYKIKGFTIFGYSNSAAERYAKNNGFTFIAVDDNPCEYEYIILNDGTAEITRYIGTEVNITIPSTIDGYTVSRIGNNAFGPTEDDEFNLVPSNIESVVIPDTVKSIGVMAFSDCTKLVSIDIPDSVKTIEPQAFSGCTSLINIELPNGLERLDFLTFMNCTSLTDIEIPDTVKSIGDRIFMNCTSLKKAKISNSIDSLPYGMFLGCSNLNEVVIGDSVTSIDYDVFFGCTGLKEITIPEKVETIAEYALGYYRDKDNGYNITKVDGFTIKGYKNTVAETYATDNGFTFIALDEEAKTGDADGDGEITSVDVTYVQRYNAMIDIDIDEDVLMNADVDKNGFLEIIDATFIQRYLAYIDIPYEIG